MPYSQSLFVSDKSHRPDREIRVDFTIALFRPPNIPGYSLKMVVRVTLKCIETDQEIQLMLKNVIELGIPGFEIKTNLHFSNLKTPINYNSVRRK